jgi:hypothetical protein
MDGYTSPFPFFFPFLPCFAFTAGSPPLFTVTAFPSASAVCFCARATSTVECSGCWHRDRKGGTRDQSYQRISRRPTGLEVNPCIIISLIRKAAEVVTNLYVCSRVPRGVSLFGSGWPKGAVYICFQSQTTSCKLEAKVTIGKNERERKGQLDHNHRRLFTTCDCLVLPRQQISLISRFHANNMIETIIY